MADEETPPAPPPPFLIANGWLQHQGKRIRLSAVNCYDRSWTSVHIRTADTCYSLDLLKNQPDDAPASDAEALIAALDAYFDITP